MENTNYKWVGVVVIGIIVATCLLTWVFMGISANNTYTDLETRAAARQDVSKITFDNTWKIIQGQSQVAVKERESFKEVFVELMNARAANDNNLLMKWSQEAQIPLSSELYRNLQNTIEAQRNKFTNAQKELIDIKREADKLKKTFPSSMFLGKRKTIEIQLVTSTKTEKTFEEGKEDDINVF